MEALLTTPTMATACSPTGLHHQCLFALSACLHSVTELRGMTVRVVLVELRMLQLRALMLQSSRSSLTPLERPCSRVGRMQLQGGQVPGTSQGHNLQTIKIGASGLNLKIANENHVRMSSHFLPHTHTQIFP